MRAEEPELQRTAPRRVWSTATLIASSAALLLGYGGARLLDRLLHFELSPKDTLGTADSVASQALGSLSLRLVDAGGVGIPVDSARWQNGRGYSHATGAFQGVLLRSAPYIDASAFAVLRRDWTTYLDRVGRYGSNGVVVPGVLPYINFDRVDGDRAVYLPGDPARARHLAWRERFVELFAHAQRRGFHVYLATDMLTLTPALERYLREREGSVNAESADLWRTYAAGFDELFDAMPEVDGVVIRVGEGGALFNVPGWEYRSEFAVRTISALRAMLHALLPVFERHRKMLILRTWSVGSGELGDLHTSPAKYAAALGELDSPSLIVSTKFVSGDFYSFQPANPTLRVGPQHRLVEFQARREYEGFGAFPNYLAPAHRAALATLRTANPRIIGSWLWTQEGGPLHAGPLSLYPLHGFWLWIDANVYATARLSRDPGANPATLAGEWARAVVPRDADAARAVATVLLRSRDAVERGLYIRPFAELQLRTFGLEAPPMLWILEWNMVGGSSVVWTTVYRGARDSVDASIADGFAAVATVDAMEATLGPHVRPNSPLLLRMDHSLQYEKSLLETLAWYRRTMLSYYRWLDTGDGRARTVWEHSAPVFTALARDHAQRFGDDLDARAYDFRAATAALSAARRGLGLTWVARALLVIITVLIARPQWGARPGAVGLLFVATVAVLSAGTSPRVIAGLALAMLGAAGTLLVFWRRLSTDEWMKARRITALSGFVALAALLAPAALRGPGLFWFVFWTPGGWRVALFAALVAAMVFTLSKLARSGRPALSGLLVAAGVAGIVLSIVAPDLASILVALDHPLGLAPMGPSFVHGLLAYFDFPRAAPWYPGIAGALLSGAGFALQRQGARQPPAPL